MNYKHNSLLLLFCFFIGVDGPVAQTPSMPSAVWPELTETARPWTRWWWMGNAVDAKNLNRLMGNYADHGIGGIEITPIYGVKGEEANNIDFLSPRWVDMLTATVIAGQRYRMGVDMNTGTGWPFGGPQVTDEFAAKSLVFHDLGKLQQEELDGFIRRMKDSAGVELLALSAFNSRGERINLMKPGNTIGQIGEAGRRVLAVSQSNTRQQVKRAAPGGEGLVFNHFSEAATRHYLDRFDQAFDGNPGIRCFFNDSYELERASAERGLFETFERLKGYDLALYTSELNGIGNNDTIARVKADYRDVLGEMLLSNFTQTWNSWANTYGALTRNQAHGSPGNLIDLYAAVDIPELETFHATHFPFLQSFIDQSGAKHTESNKLFKKFASSAAHQKGSPLVSCETFTWLNEHFRTPLYQCKPELDELFVKGVNHLFLHGTAYSPEHASWPGWCFYASAHMEPSNPQWEHLKAMTAYITRCQSVLQQGQHTNDFLVLWSPDDYYANPKGLEKKLTLHNSESWVSMPEIEDLLAKGYLFDFTTDRIVAGASVRGASVLTFGTTAYQAIVVPETKRIKLETFRKLLSLASDGATILFRSWPETVSGFRDYPSQENELNRLIQSVGFQAVDGFQKAIYGKGCIYLGPVEPALTDAGISRETLIDRNIKHISRKNGSGFYYFIANHEAEAFNDWLQFKNWTPHALLMNPMSGDVKLAETAEGKVKIKLKAGESRIVYFINELVNGVSAEPEYTPGQVFQLAGPWTLKAISGGPVLFETQKLDKLRFWIEVDSDVFEHFSGTATYETSFSLKSKKANGYWLKFGQVEASVRVIVNGQEAGILWAYPYELEIGKYLKKGKNSLRFEVSNLGANRIRYLDKNGLEWKKFENINIVNLDYKPLDASDWKILPSGLNGEIKVIEQIIK
ncbi:MAG: glycosyl hydrolase [Mangrovibacterium sp.]